MAFPIFNQIDSSALAVHQGTLNVQGTISDDPFRNGYSVWQDAGSTTLAGNAILQLDVSSSGYKMRGGSFVVGGNSNVLLLGKFTNTGGTATVGAQSTFSVVREFDNQAGNLSVGEGANVSLSQGFSQEAGDSALAYNAEFDVTGALAENGGTFTFGDGFGGARIMATDGVQVAAGAVLSGYGSITGDVTNSGEVDDTVAALTINGFYRQEGQATATIRGGPLNVSGLVDLQGGTFTLAGTIVAQDTMLIENGATLHGNGAITVTGSLSNEGLIDIAGGTGPGPAGGALAVNGDYTQTGTGVLNIHLYGSSYDELNVSGLATLAGELNVLAMNGFTPYPGPVFEVVSYGSRSGEFDAIALPQVYYGHWDPRYYDYWNPNSVDLRVTV